MSHVDALSRAPYEEPHKIDSASLNVFKVAVDDVDLLFSMQIQDQNISNIIKKCHENDKTNLETTYATKDVYFGKAIQNFGFFQKL